MNILIVDDDSEIREAMAQSFTHEGFRVFQAAQVSDAIEILRLNPIDVVITDLKMPAREGNSLISEIRRDKGRKPLMFVFSGAVPEPKDKLIDLGVDGIFRKPTGWRDLKQAVIGLKSEQGPS
jgi:DNA-binding response OmpR family regulator